ncbi:MAG: AI-2E family transporter [Bacteroidota bacterium]|nr:AI-2E family transporter [Bacteroidota bacterium]
MTAIILPRYLKYTVILFAVILIFFTLIVARSILIPVSFGLVLSLLLHPVCTRLERLKLPRAAAVIIAIIGVIALLAGTIWILTSQFSRIAADLSEIGAKFSSLMARVQQFFEDRLGIQQVDQSKYIQDSLENIVRSSSSFFTGTLSATAGLFADLVVILLTLFFFLYYSHFLKVFLLKLVDNRRHEELKDILSKVSLVVQDYISGLFMVMGIVAVLNSVGLLLLGIKYAFFFGALAAFLTIIPYIGIFIGSLLPIVFALATKDSLWYPVGVAGIFWFVQFLEGNFITPNVIGNKVSINPFAAVMALFVGAEVWGPAGMILFIPFLAMAKVLFDVIGPLKPFGYVLGNPHDEEKTHSFDKKADKLKWKRWVKGKRG